MKSIVKMILIGAALAAPSMAHAQTCVLSPSASISLGDFLKSGDQFVASSAAASIAEVLAADSVFSKNGCSAAEVQQRLLQLNNWQPEQTLSRATPVRLVRPDVAAPVAVSVPVAEASAPAVVPTVPPVVAKPSPELTAVRTKLATAKRERAELAPRVKSIAALPVAALTSGERDMLNKAAGLDQRIAKLEGIEARMTKVEADIVSLKNDMNNKANSADVQALKNRVRVLENAPPVAEKTGWTWRDAGLAAMLLLVFIGIVFGYRKLDARIKRKANDESLDIVSGKFEGLRSELDELKVRVGTNEEKIESVVHQVGAVDIRFGPGQQEALNALPEGETLTAEVHIELAKKFEIRFKRIANGLFLADELKSKFRNHDPKVPIKNPLGFVSRNYGKGEFAGFMLSVVEEAAA